MNYFKYTCLVAVFAFAFQNVHAQKAKKNKKQIIETEFKVSGVCGMCEERIENALSVKGVKYADWDLDTKVCKVVFNKSKIEESRLHELLTDVGHDTEKLKATDEEYANVHECCKYRSQGDCD